MAFAQAAMNPLDRRLTVSVKPTLFDRLTQDLLDLHVATSDAGRALLGNFGFAGCCCSSCSCCSMGSGSE